jgi:hypothetical protein
MHLSFPERQRNWPPKLFSILSLIYFMEKEKNSSSAFLFRFPEVVFIVEKLDGAHRRSVHAHLVPVLRSLLLHAL